MTTLPERDLDAIPAQSDQPLALTEIVRSVLDDRAGTAPILGR